ncbi:mRNA turnover and ribosome assembly protein [Microbotryomycetes sp. JL221]|nr:mRNA turnover and ribosome assembly protein [Microbotryomycetes sp. JL221]
MPRSKRDRVVALTQTDKKGKQHKLELINQVRQYSEQYQFLWVFDVQHMRNNVLKQVRQAWKDSKNAVMRKALGTSVEDECRLGAHKIANLLEGDRGLMFTNDEPQVVLEWFKDFTKPDFARSGNKVEQTFELPEGPIVLQEGEGPAPHSLEPQFRKLGLQTYLVKGVPTLKAPHTVCKQGDTLNSNQVNLLKMFNKQFATFQIVPVLGINVADGSVVGGSQANDMDE